MAETTNRTLNVYIQTGDAQKAYDKLIAKEKQLNQAIKDTSDPKKIQQLNRELEKLQEPIGRAAKKLSGELAPSMRDLQKTVKDLGNQLHHMSSTDADFSKVLKQYRQAQVELKTMKANAKDLSDEFDRSKNNNPFGRVLEFAKGTLLGGAIQGIISQFAGFFGDAMDEALNAEETTARFKSTLDNLGRSDAFDRIIAKADEIAAHFKYLDNDDVVGVFNQLIDYGKLTEKQMNDLLPVIINFAAKQRISISDSASVIIKALEGNGKALKQYGIELDTTGSSADNLQVVMGTLANKVNGAADAFLNSDSGHIKSTKQQFADLKEEVGQRLIPVLSSLLGWVNKIFIGLGYLKTKISNTASDIKAFFSDGILGVIANKNERKKAEQAEIETGAADILVKPFADKSKAEIDAQIKKVQDELNFKNAYLKSLPRLIAEGAADPSDIAAAQQKISVTTKALEKLNQMSAAAVDVVLGDGGDDQKDKAEKAKAAAEKRKQQVAKALADYKALMKTLQDLQNQVNGQNMTDRQREFFQLEIKYQDLKKQAAGHKDAMLLVEKLYHDEKTNLQNKFAKIDLDAEKKYLDAVHKQREEFDKKQLEDEEKQRAALAKAVKDGLKRMQDNNIAGVQLDILKEGKNPFSENRLQLQKKLLDLQRDQELENKDLTENQKLLIEKEYQDKRRQAEIDHYNGLVGVVLQFAQQALAVLSQFQQNKTDSENRELERDRKMNDRKKENLKKQLDGKRLTQQDYDRQIAEMDKKQEAKEKQVRLQQFRRQQRSAVVNALINGAQGVQKSIAEWGMPFALPWIALTAAMTAAQIAAISKQQPPEFAKGGLLHGPSHQSKSKGMPVTNPNTGQVQAFMEGGEAITNKRTMADGNAYTLSGTPSQIISRLNGLHGGVQWTTGATLVPAWRSVKPQRMNFDLLNNSMRTVRMFAQGGVFQDSGNTTAAGGSTMDLQVLQQLAIVVDNLNSTLANGIQAPVKLTDIENATARKQAIIDDATMKA